MQAVLSKLLCVFLFLGGTALMAQQVDPEIWSADIPEPLLGPYIIDPETLEEFDRASSDCASAGRLNFQCLIYRDSRSRMTKSNLESNPFEIETFREVQKTVKTDIENLKNYPQFGGGNAQSLKLDFLTFAGSKIELVGVVNRMDRQFNRDDVPEHGAPLKCGEISAVYRFGYEGDLPAWVPGERHYQSRLPVTMNVVFPAIPWSASLSCQVVAQRWLAYVDAMKLGLPKSIQMERARVLVASLRPQDVDRIELNMQGSRVPAGLDDTNFGTLGTYIIRVFRWVPGSPHGLWRPSYLTNQIDRARLLGSDGDENTCAEERGKRLDKQELVDFLLSMNPRGQNAIGDIDNGLLNIPRKFLACRAISISPGGAARSGNQPFWNSADVRERIISDDDIEAKLAQYRAAFPDTLNFVGNADEFRTRLNEMTCSGCHQTRAIAGFHLPGSDRAGTASVNAVFLPGSAHFFGDQRRRMQILGVLAKTSNISRKALAASYTTRPQNRFTDLKPKPGQTEMSSDSVQLVGGWGGACLLRQKPGGIRSWPCATHLECRATFASANQPDIGICMNPASRIQLGEAMQLGEVSSKLFGFDKYRRKMPPMSSAAPNDTRISIDHLTAPANNSYFAAHQEFYQGEGGIDREDGETEQKHAMRVRDQETGGFPAGALRLSECNGLKSEATCALLAASGFNACLGEVGAGKRTPESCFGIYTNYAGVRACDPANPCRDDYICLRPMGYTTGNSEPLFKARKTRRDAARNSQDEQPLNRKRLAITYFGEGIPDSNWLGRNGGRGDLRGVCIPPYFVFQFKADGHKVPVERHMKGLGHR